MIDFRVEELLPLSRAAREWPGGGVHVSTLHRYRLRGARAISDWSASESVAGGALARRRLIGSSPG